MPVSYDRLQARGVPDNPNPTDSDGQLTHVYQWEVTNNAAIPGINNVSVPFRIPVLC